MVVVISALHNGFQLNQQQDIDEVVWDDGRLLQSCELGGQKRGKLRDSHMIDLIHRQPRRRWCTSMLVSCRLPTMASQQLSRRSGRTWRQFHTLTEMYRCRLPIDCCRLLSKTGSKCSMLGTLGFPTFLKRLVLLCNNDIKTLPPSLALLHES